MELKDKIKLLRVRRNLSQQQVADAIGVTRITFNRYEAGAITPRESTLKELADFFEIPADFFSENNSSPQNFEYDDLLMNNLAFFSGGSISEQDKDLLFNAIQSAYLKCKLEKSAK